MELKQYLSQDFICVWDDVAPKDFCLWLIDYMEKTDFINKRSDPHRVDKQIQLNAFSPNESNFLMHLINICAVNYMDKYPCLKEYDYFSSLVLLQKTEPTQGYHAFHCENFQWNYQNRTLAWMMYLNDVDDGGETEFLYQKLKIKPKTGRIVIWPGSFTHLHRGNPPMTNKYIATGWYANSFGIEKSFFNPNATT